MPVSKRMHLAVAIALAGIIIVFAPASAEALADTGQLVEMVGKYLEAENGLLVRGDRIFAPAVALSDSFAAESQHRANSIRQDRQTLDISKIGFTGVHTTVTLVRTIAPSPALVQLIVHESTMYPYADASRLVYTYGINHTVSFELSGDGAWRLAGIRTEDPTGVQLHQERTSQQQAEVLAKAREGYAKIHSDSIARERDKRARVQAAGLDSHKAADWAHYYSTHTVDYTRDKDDCTTFVSMALKHGGWAEVTGFYQSDHVWWYGCDWCIPRHSYTFGGSANWSRFALWSGRTIKIPTVWGLAIADVLQFGDKAPVHTTIVTGFDSQRNPVLSQHSYDAADLPLQLILDHNYGKTFWAYRT